MCPSMFEDHDQLCGRIKVSAEILLLSLSSTETGKCFQNVQPSIHFSLQETFFFFFTILSNKHYHYYWLSLGFWKSCIFVKVSLLQTINLLIQCLSSYLYYPFLIASILPSNWNGGNSKVFLKNTVFVHVLFLVLLFFVKSIAMPVWKRRKRRRKILKVAVKLPFPPSKRCQQFLKSTAWKIYHQISQYRKETKPPPLINLHA